MTPFTAMADFTWGDSNQSSSRSAMLMDMRRVTSPIVRTFMPRWRQARRKVSTRSAGRREPSFGGTVNSSGPSTSASPVSQASHCGMASASRLDHFTISS